MGILLSQGQTLLSGVALESQREQPREQNLRKHGLIMLEIWQQWLQEQGHSSATVVKLRQNLTSSQAASLPEALSQLSARERTSLKTQLGDSTYQTLANLGHETEPSIVKQDLLNFRESFYGAFAKQDSEAPLYSIVYSALSRHFGLDPNPSQSNAHRVQDFFRAMPYRLGDAQTVGGFAAAGLAGTGARLLLQGASRRYLAGWSFTQKAVPLMGSIGAEGFGFRLGEQAGAAYQGKEAHHGGYGEVYTTISLLKGGNWLGRWARMAPGLRTVVRHVPLVGRGISTSTELGALYTAGYANHGKASLSDAIYGLVDARMANVIVSAVPGVHSTQTKWNFRIHQPSKQIGTWRGAQGRPSRGSAWFGRGRFNGGLQPAYALNGANRLPQLPWSQQNLHAPSLMVGRMGSTGEIPSAAEATRPLTKQQEAHRRAFKNFVGDQFEISDQGWFNFVAAANTRLTQPAEITVGLSAHRSTTAQSRPSSAGSATAEEIALWLRSLGPKETKEAKAARKARGEKKLKRISPYDAAGHLVRHKDSAGELAVPALLARLGRSVENREIKYGLIGGAVKQTGRAALAGIDALNRLTGLETPEVQTPAKEARAEAVITDPFIKDTIWALGEIGGEQAFTGLAQFSEAIPPNYRFANLEPVLFQAMAKSGGADAVPKLQAYASRKRSLLQDMADNRDLRLPDADIDNLVRAYSYLGQDNGGGTPNHARVWPAVKVLAEERLDPHAQPKPKLLLGEDVLMSLHTFEGEKPSQFILDHVNRLLAANSKQFRWVRGDNRGLWVQELTEGVLILGARKHPQAVAKAVALLDKSDVSLDPTQQHALFTLIASRPEDLASMNEGTGLQLRNEHTRWMGQAAQAKDGGNFDKWKHSFQAKRVAKKKPTSHGAQFAIKSLEWRSQQGDSSATKTLREILELDRSGGHKEFFTDNASHGNTVYLYNHSPVIVPAMQALGKLGDTKAIPALYRQARSVDPNLSTQAFKVLKGLGKQTQNTDTRHLIAQAILSAGLNKSEYASHVFNPDQLARDMNQLAPQWLGQAVANTHHYQAAWQQLGDPSVNVAELNTTTKTRREALQNHLKPFKFKAS